MPATSTIYAKCVNAKTNECLGIKTLREWADELGIVYATLYYSYKHCSNTKKDDIVYHFLPLTDEEWAKLSALSEEPVHSEPDPEPEEKKPTVSEFQAAAIAQGKTYAQLQAEETLAKLKSEKEEAMETTNEVKPAFIATTPALVLSEVSVIRLKDFAKMADETVIIVNDCYENWLFTAPSASPVFESLEWTVKCFRTGLMDGSAILKVVVA